MSLFQTEAWQTALWGLWGGTSGFDPVVAGSSGVSGLYVDRYRFKHVLPVRCLQFVGTNYRRISTPRTEYNTFGLEHGDAAASFGAVERLLSSVCWSEAVFKDMLADSKEVAWLRQLSDDHGWGLRVVAEDSAFSINTRGTFEDYLKGLGQNSRLRLYNRRKVLEGLGKISEANFWPDRAGEFFECLNAFHVERWGSPCFNPDSLKFHEMFLRDVADEGGEPRLSVMTCDGSVVSVLYNVIYSGVVYNIQAGFLETFHKKLALGTLHLGYSIENAFHARDIHCFDMLAGSGKNENYKVRIATDRVSLTSIMLVKSPLFKLLYSLKK